MSAFSARRLRRTVTWTQKNRPACGRMDASKATGLTVILAAGGNALWKKTKRKPRSSPSRGRAALARPLCARRSCASLWRPFPASASSPSTQTRPSACPRRWACMSSTRSTTSAMRSSRPRSAASTGRPSRCSTRRASASSTPWSSATALPFSPSAVRRRRVLLLGQLLPQGSHQHARQRL